ncbi:hypothetical protein [Natronobiforma cellulositropha]|uniref:hypothetical protein n=1 Tax=Natronobiforma cellulositropha TaxID=1679076 RepID=UPI0021D60914|nr:hypothetical protein [Natronobiforma cellulositropha]
MTSHLWTLSEKLVQKNGDSPPPPDVTVGSLCLGGIAVFAVAIAVITAVADPTTEPLKGATLAYGVPGLVLLAIAVTMYQRRPIGWIGLLGAVLLSLAYTLSFEVTVGLRDIVLVAAHVALLGYLVYRRHVYL